MTARLQHFGRVWFSAAVIITRRQSARGHLQDGAMWASPVARSAMDH